MNCGNKLWSMIMILDFVRDKCNSLRFSNRCRFIENNSTRRTSSETFEFVRISFARINISLRAYSKRETRKNSNSEKFSQKVILSNFDYFSLRRRSFWSSSDASTSNWVVTRREKDK